MEQQHSTTFPVNSVSPCTRSNVKAIFLSGTFITGGTSSFADVWCTPPESLARSSSEASPTSSSPQASRVPSTSQASRVPGTSQAYRVPSTPQAHRVPSTSQVSTIQAKGFGTSSAARELHLCLKRPPLPCETKNFQEIMSINCPFCERDKTVFLGMG